MVSVSIIEKKGGINLSVNEPKGVCLNIVGKYISQQGGEEGTGIASEVMYNNSLSGLKGTNVQAALDELAPILLTQTEYDALKEKIPNRTYYIYESE